MPLLFIRALNAEFHSRDEGAHYDRAEDALALATQSAVALAADEIQRGERSSAVEISIEQEDGTAILRSVVAISVAALLPTPLTID